MLVTVIIVSRHCTETVQCEKDFIDDFQIERLISLIPKCL